jgi:hypothetical protein
MRSRTSRSKPFMTDNTTISTATPIATPRHRDGRDEGDEAIATARAQVAAPDLELVLHS